MLLALRWWPETWDLSAGRQVDVRGMLLLGGAMLCLTVALVEANPFAGHLPLWLSLMQAAILLGVTFFWWERRAPNPMITPGLFANRQFRNANIGMLFFAAGAIGSLLLLSLVFTNLWGYEPIEAGLALLPVPLCGLLVWPLVGRAADTRPPGELAKPALIAMAVGMIWVSFLPATADSAWTYIQILPGLALIGVGMGIGFPSLNVGAMGAVAGPEVGLASGVLNTAQAAGHGARRGAARGHLRRRAPRPHVLVRRRADRGRRGRVGDPRAAGGPGDPVHAPRLHGRQRRPLRARARASTRRSSARPPGPPARASPGRSGTRPCSCSRCCRCSVP